MDKRICLFSLSFSLKLGASEASCSEAITWNPTRECCTVANRGGRKRGTCSNSLCTCWSQSRARASSCHHSVSQLLYRSLPSAPLIHNLGQECATSCPEALFDYWRWANLRANSLPSTVAPFHSAAETPVRIINIIWCCQSLIYPKHLLHRLTCNYWN